MPTDQLLPLDYIKTNYGRFGFMENYYEDPDRIGRTLHLGIALAKDIEKIIPEQKERFRILVPSSNAGLLEVGLREQFNHTGIDSRISIISGDYSKIDIIYNRHPRMRADAASLPCAGKSIDVIIDYWGALTYAMNNDIAALGKYLRDFGGTLNTENLDHLLDEYNRVLKESGILLTESLPQKMFTDLLANGAVSKYLPKLSTSVFHPKDNFVSEPILQVHL